MFKGATVGKEYYSFGQSKIIFNVQIMSNIQYIGDELFKFHVLSFGNQMKRKI